MNNAKMPAFFHYSNSKHAVLVPQRGPRRHGGEAGNAVGRPAVYLFDQAMPEFRLNCEPVKFEHRVEIAEADPLLEQEDAEWMPHTWVYFGDLPVVEVREWNDATGAHEAGP